MKIISFIEDHKVIDKIIDHLKLTFMAERPPPPHHVQQELLMAAEEMGEYF
ncbi:MAG: acid--CoA ligase [Candidatus Aenigmarchaeota archaeon]|nr:acid--CoA ligase [Candidatus Aenigmarchaeota archaeon]